MLRTTLAACSAALCLLLGGCVQVAPPAPPPPTTIELVNATGLDVRANLYTSGDPGADNLFNLFVAANLNTDWTTREFAELRPFETATVTLECDELVSAGVNAAILFDAASLTTTQSADQIFLRRDANFTCGPTIRFVYFLDNGAFRVRVEFP